VSIQTEALTVIGARTSHGKTALLVNLFANALDLYPDRPFAFLSYEQTRRQVYVRLLQRESGVVLDPYKNAAEVQRYVRDGKADNEDLERARAKLEVIAEAGRLFVLDIAYPIDGLISIVEQLKKRGVAGIFVDYLGQIPVKKAFSTRQATVQHISGKLKDAAKQFHIPIVVASQLNRDAGDDPRLEHFREADDPVFDANTVLSLVNPAMLGNSVDESGTVTLKLKILKNRDGVVGKTICLDFDLATQRITESEKVGTW
jgi:replicative DNA helicase